MQDGSFDNFTKLEYTLCTTKNDLNCIYSLRRFQITLQFVASFHIDKDIGKQPDPAFQS